MVINAHTKIATILKQHQDALETIISINPAFQKLRNPVLRKLMAGRTSIGMACKVGGCTVESFIDKLKPLGFEASEESTNANNVTPLTTVVEAPACLQSIEEHQVVRLDVRSLLEEGTDPLGKIMTTLGTLKQNQVLVIINSFEPTPLINLLKKRGYSSFIETIHPTEIHTWFFRDNTMAKPVEPIDVNNSGWEEIVSHFEGRIKFIDVRHLEMPQPMHSILEALESLPSTDALYVYHKRIPVFLLPELAEQGFEYRTKKLSEQEVHLLIFRDTL